MDWSIAAILAQDGIGTGAIYALLALALVLVFSVTRVIFIAQGEFVAYGALTLAALQSHTLPQTAALLVGLGAAVFLQGLPGLYRQPRHRLRLLSMCALKFILFPLVVYGVSHATVHLQLPMVAQVGMTLAIVVPLGPFIYRLAFAPLAESSTLVLLIAAVGVHFALLGMGLVMFGAEGARTVPFSDVHVTLGSLDISGQSMVTVAVALLSILALYVYFEHTLAGKALRATAINRLGAQLVGIGTASAGRRAFTLAAVLGTVSGMLIAPMTTMYYDSGFLIGLKGFVGAIIGALISYPAAAAGALLVGLLESYSAFWASGFKEIIIFTMIIPVLLWRSLARKAIDEDAS